MTILKSSIILMVVLVEQSTQFSISSELNSELPSSPLPSSSSSSSNRPTGCLKTIGQCFKMKPTELAACALERTMNSMNCLITTNNTWQFNQFVSLKKNDDWTPPTEMVEARQEQTLFQSVLSKLSDLIASRSLQFSMPLSEISESIWGDGRVKSGFDFGALDIGGGLGAHGESGRKKKMKGGFNGMWAVIAMMAQLFLGKIAFLAGAALLLSKVSLLFSIVNALKKHNSHGGDRGDHVVYADQGHGSYHERSFIESPMDWMFTELPPSTLSPDPSDPS